MKTQKYAESELFCFSEIITIKSFRHDNATLSLMYDVCFATVEDPEVNTAVGGGGVLETQSCRVWDGVRVTPSQMPCTGMEIALCCKRSITARLAADTFMRKYATKFDEFAVDRSG